MCSRCVVSLQLQNVHVWLIWFILASVFFPFQIQQKANGTFCLLMCVIWHETSF